MITGYVSYILSLFFHGEFILAIVVQIFVFIIHVTTYIMCFMATIKRNKLMLIPFLIVTILHIFIYIGLGIYVIYIGCLFVLTDNDALTGIGVLVFIFLVPIVIGLIVSTYFVIVVSKFYYEISIGISAAVLPTIVIQHSTP